MSNTEIKQELFQGWQHFALVVRVKCIQTNYIYITILKMLIVFAYVQ